MGSREKERADERTTGVDLNFRAALRRASRRKKRFKERKRERERGGAVGERRRRKLEEAVSKRRQFLHLGEIKTSDAAKRRVFFNFATLMRP